jgi:hypothetical protein
MTTTPLPATVPCVIETSVAFETTNDDRRAGSTACDAKRRCPPRPFAAYHLAIHVRDLVEGDVDEA